MIISLAEKPTPGASTFTSLKDMAVKSLKAVVQIETVLVKATDEGAKYEEVANLGEEVCEKVARM